jgi:tetratricopeptide (TPR) repeat protein
MRSKRVLVIVLTALVALVSCNRDPSVAKKRYLDSGNKYFERGKFKEASIMYRNALQKDLRYGPAHYKLGLTYIRTGQLAPAVQSLRRAVELLPVEQPDQWDAAIKLSEIYLAASPDKQYLEEVEGYTKQLLKRDPNSYDGHRLSGDLGFVRSAAALRVGQKDPAKEFLADAIAEYRKADAIKPEQQGIGMQLARALLAYGDTAGAEHLYLHLIDKHKNLDYAYTELYRLYMLTGKPEEGEKVLKMGFQGDLQQFGFLTMLAAHYYNQKRPSDMIGVLEQIKAHSKEFPAAYLAVGDFYLRMGGNDDAIREYRQGIAKDPNKKPTYQKRIIEALMRQGKREEAAQVNGDILKADPADNDAHGLAATLLLDKGDINRALTELQAVVARAPNNAVAHYNLGRAHEARGESEQARQEYQKAVDIRPDYVLARLAVAQLQLRKREWDAALRTAEQVLSVDKTNGNARLIQSAAMMGQQRYADSRTMLAEMQKASPNSADIYYQLGLIDLAEKKYKESEADFRRSYELNPANSRGLMGIVETYFAQHRPDDAINMLQAEAVKAPKRVDLRLAVASASVMAARFDMAVTQYKTALDMLGADAAARADIYLRLGETYRRKGDLVDAIPALEQARKSMPDNSVVLSTLALALDGSGRKAEARKIYETTLKNDPNNGVALNNLAFLIADGGGDLDQALTLAQRAKQMLPNTAEVSDTLGLIYLRKNLSDNAIDIFQDLVNKQPNQPTFRYHLGMAFSQKGDRPRAIQQLQQALKQNPPLDERERIQQLMNRLG